LTTLYLKKQTLSGRALVATYTAGERADKPKLQEQQI